MKKLLVTLLLLFVVAVIGSTIFFWDGEGPIFEFAEPAAVGPDTGIDLTIIDSGRGLRNVQVSLVQGESESILFEESYTRGWCPWESSEADVQVVLDQWRELDLAEGPFAIRLVATDQGNLWFFRNSAEKNLTLEYDSRPPRIDVLTTQHYLRQGGSESALYRVGESGESGVQVGDRRYRGYSLTAQPSTYLALFALGHDQDPEVPVQVWARDQAGNESLVRLWCKTFPQNFRQRSIEISDRFIQTVAPEILSNAPGVEAGETPLETFLTINRDLRVKNNNQIRELTTASEPRFLFTEPFLQLSNSQVEAVFADRRTYTYQGQEIDRQTHLGFDLASLARSSVEASNAGKVVYADYLGIYGNTVILDHGMGLFSLYGHLSAIGVETGAMVGKGDSLGRTGQTGLAGGDHLHFSMLLQGEQVNPVEWWDPEWVRLHVFTRLEGDQPQED